MPPRILIVGAGGLGCPVAIELAQAGAALTVIDPDRVEPSNLHRQILYREEDVGAPKALALARRLREWFPSVAVEGRVGEVDADFQPALEAFDVMIDGTDRFDTKLLLNDLAIATETPFVFGGVVGMEGQVLAVSPLRSACLRCLFDDAPRDLPTCETAGVLGPVAGIVGAEQARRGLSLLGSAPLVDRLFTLDARTRRRRDVVLRRAARCLGCGPERVGPRRPPPLPGASDDGAEVLDLRGKVCPDTYRETNRRLVGRRPGERLWVWLTSDEAARNVPASVSAAGHRVLARERGEGLHRILIEPADLDGERSPSEP